MSGGRYAHGKGVLHRDLKPVNVFVRHLGDVQVLDWGVAKVRTREEAAAGEPAAAEPASRRARRTAIALMALVLAVFMTAAALLYGQNRSLERAEINAKEEAETAQKASEKAQEEAEKARQAKADAQTEADKARRAETRARYLQYGNLLERFQGAWRGNDIANAAALCDRCRRDDLRDLIGWEHRYLDLLLNNSFMALKRGRQPQPVVAVAFSSDGSLLAGAFPEDKQVAVWDARTGHEQFALDAGDTVATALAFNRDGGLLAAATREGPVLVWDTATRRVRVLKGHGREVTAITFSPDSTRLAAASADRAVLLWDLATGQPAPALKEPSPDVTVVCYSPDGTRLATAADKVVTVWDAATGRRLHALRGHTDPVIAVGFSPEGTRLATGSSDRSVRVWDARADDKGLFLRRHADAVTAVHFSPDGTRLASASRDRMVRVWDLATGEEARVLIGHKESVLSVHFSPDGARLATAADQSARIWDVRSGQEALSLTGHADRVNAVCFTPDGTRVVSAAEDRGVRVTDAGTGQEILALTWDSSVQAVAVGAGGRAAAAVGGALWLWNTNTGWKEPFPGDLKDRVQAVDFSRDGGLLAAAGRGAVRVWDVRGRAPALVFERPHSRLIRAVAFSPDGTRLAAASSDQTTLIWTLAGGEPRVLRGHNQPVAAVSFSREGNRIATGAVDGSMFLWDLGSAAAEPRRLEGGKEPVHGIGFSPDGTRLAAASQDGTVRVWDVREGVELLTLKGHGQGARAVGFSPDGTRLATAAGDGTVRIWGGGIDRRLFDPLAATREHLEQARRAARGRQPFALAFHLRPLLLSWFRQATTADRPRATFPLWARRPPVARAGEPSWKGAVVLDPVPLALLDVALTFDLKPSAGWEHWAARGWVRHLRGRVDDALADLERAANLRPGEPMVEAVRGAVLLHHGRKAAAADVAKQLSEKWPDLRIAAWHVAEAAVALDQGANDRTAWHRERLGE